MATLLTRIRMGRGVRVRLSGHTGQIMALVLSKKRADPGGVYGWHFGSTTAETRVAVVVLAPQSAERAYGKQSHDVVKEDCGLSAETSTRPAFDTSSKTMLSNI